VKESLYGALEMAGEWTSGGPRKKEKEKRKRRSRKTLTFSSLCIAFVALVTIGRL
jgi:hypothetical protein